MTAKNCALHPGHEKEINKNATDIRTLYARSIPTWARALFIGTIGTLFFLLGANWLYAVSTYATKDEVKDLKTDIKTGINEIKNLIRSKP